MLSTIWLGNNLDITDTDNKINYGNDNGISEGEKSKFAKKKN